MEALARNYTSILQRLLVLTPRVVLMMQYRPDRTAEGDKHYKVYAAMATTPGAGTGHDKICKLMEAVFRPILAAATKHGLPVIDLPNAIDPMDGANFVSGIEPSAQGGARIAALIAATVRAHPFRGGGGGGSVVYSCAAFGPDGTPQGFAGVANTSEFAAQWAVATHR
jgi:hypothetical protein